MAIRDLQARLVELGRIRMGEKGARGEPKRLTHWRLTSASQSLLAAAATLYGGKPRPWAGAPDAGYFELYTEAAELDILIPPTLASYSQFYEQWEAGGLLSRCDGDVEQLTDEPCDHGDHAEYQIVTRLSVMLPRLPGLGVWRMESSGWNAATTIPATMELLRMLGATGFIPAVLRIEQRSKKVRDEKGKPLTHRWGEPRLDLAGTPAQMLAGVPPTPALALPAGPIVALQRDAEAAEPTPINRRERVARPALEAAPDLPAQAQGRAAATAFGEPPPFDDEDEPRGARKPQEPAAAATGVNGQPALDLPASRPADPATGEILEFSLPDFSARVNREHLGPTVAPARARLFGDRATGDLTPGELGALYQAIRRPTPVGA